jgi:hypothetical protein
MLLENTEGVGFAQGYGPKHFWCGWVLGEDLISPLEAPGSSGERLQME